MQDFDGSDIFLYRLLKCKQDLVERTVSEMRLSSFTVPTGDIGCFWRAAGASLPPFFLLALC
jgi:hypothetical protein